MELSVVSGVLLVLIAMSILTWTIAFIKFRNFGRADKQSASFQKAFWDARDWSAGQKVADDAQGDLATLAKSGYTEYDAFMKNPVSLRFIGEPAEVLQQPMRRTLANIIRHHEHGLSELATVGAISPFVGLFGTVWGIMNAFRGLSNVAQATLSQVAPGIAEALVATAIGLFAAIPAVVAYNRFASSVDRLSVRYESFMEEFTNILQRKS